MTEVEEIQEKINNLFIKAFKDYKGGLNLSVPLVPRISKAFLVNRTIVIGQETNTWYRHGEDELKNVFVEDTENIIKVCLNDRYDLFIGKHVKSYRGKFWAFNRLLYKKNIIDGEIVLGDELSHCWVNLFAVEGCKNKKHNNGRPTVNRELASNIVELQGTLLYEIFRLLKPKLIIFLTGHSLDEILMKTAVCSSDIYSKPIDSKKILNVNMLSQIIVKDKDHILKGVNIIRSYHPSYFMGRINTFKSLKKSLRSNNLNCSNADYYTNVLTEKLKCLKMK